jgi:acyl-CoA thioesterase
MDKGPLLSTFQRESAKGFGGKLGLRIVDVHPGYAVVDMVPQKDDVNIFGMVHGGVIFSLMDEAFSISCNSHGNLAVALSVNINYHNPASKGCTLQAESREIHRSAKTATYEIKVTDENSVLIASCQALAYRKGDKIPFLYEKR